MKFHLVSNTDHEMFLDHLSKATQNPPGNYFVQEVQFKPMFDETAPSRQIFTALIVFGEIPIS